MSDSELTIIEQRNVIFYEDSLLAVLAEEGGKREVFVPIRPITDTLGLTLAPQTRRIKNDPVLSEVVTDIPVLTPGGMQKMRALPLDFVPGFLFGINSARVKPELRERIIRYQRECFRVLSEAFREGKLTRESEFHELLTSESEAVQAYRMILAMEKLARNQILLEATLSDHGSRLERLESMLGDPERYITPGEASRISQAVKAVAFELGVRTGRNEFGGVYGELYRRFDISAYRELPAKRYKEAIHFLTEWYQTITGADSIPF